MGSYWIARGSAVDELGALNLGNGQQLRVAAVDGRMGRWGWLLVYVRGFGILRAIDVSCY